MIKMRFTFENEAEKEEAVKALAESFDLISVSKDYKNRDNNSFRVYIDAELKQERGNDRGCI